ncbi:hypothetical protein SESBI_24265 [Sesbania bispinosa]|nr:hypothetical protein SESBI_24265 [Sesbania bispinosa]
MIRTFIWVRVLVDIKKPLITGCWVPRKDLPKLSEKAMAGFNSSIKKYGPKVGVPPTKPILRLMQEQGPWTKGRTPTLEEGQGSQVQRQKQDPTTKETREEDFPKVVRNEMVRICLATFVRTCKMLSREKMLFSEKTVTLDPTHTCVQEVSATRKVTNSGNFESGPTQLKGPSVTLVDLKEQIIRAGLGPQNMEDIAMLEQISVSQKRKGGEGKDIDEDLSTIRGRVTKKHRSNLLIWEEKVNKDEVSPNKMAIFSAQQNNLMAEEAGLTMPPPQP